MSKHTQGPWRAGRSDMATIVDGIDSKWIYAGDQYVAVASGRIEGAWDEVMANARLIAAAPDLLKAAKALAAEWDAERFEWVENRDLGMLIRDGQPATGGVLFDALNAAITKAEGAAG